MGLFALELLVPLVLYVARLCYKLDVMTLHFETLWDAMRQYETTAVLHTGIYWEYFMMSATVSQSFSHSFIGALVLACH